MKSRLQQVRLARGLSLAALARDLKCSIAELASIEAGLLVAPPDLAQRLRDYFGQQNIYELSSHFLASVRPDPLPAAERELLACYRGMREGQKRVLFELARLMSAEEKGGGAQVGSD